jgi:predicted Zn-dependent protease with MMP-like domain
MGDTPEDWAGRMAPGLDEFEVLARKAFDTLPDFFRDRIDGVPFVVADFPDDEMLTDLGLESPFDLLGLFHGVGATAMGAGPMTGELPNRIWLFRRPILDYWAEHEEALGAVITHVLIHEIGHHFGFSDADMEAMEAEAARGQK